MNTVDPIEQEHSGKFKEVGSKAIWSLSTCRPGSGVEQLRDNRIDTYWQSDGNVPHLVNVEFRRRTTVSDIYIYLDHKLDGTYTPSRISLRAGTHYNDLQEIEVAVLAEPDGWVRISTKDVNDRPRRMFMLQIAITKNHDDGKDTHVRQIRIHGPNQHGASLEGFCTFSTVNFQQYATIR